MPELLFRASALTFDKELKNLTQYCVSFLWKGKDKIKCLALISDYSDGGQLKLKESCALKSLLRIITVHGN